MLLLTRKRGSLWLVGCVSTFVRHLLLGLCLVLLGRSTGRQRFGVCLLSFRLSRKLTRLGLLGCGLGLRRSGACLPSLLRVLNRLPGRRHYPGQEVNRAVRAFLVLNQVPQGPDRGFAPCPVCVRTPTHLVRRVLLPLLGRPLRRLALFSRLLRWRRHPVLAFNQVARALCVLPLALESRAAVLVLNQVPQGPDRGFAPCPVCVRTPTHLVRRVLLPFLGQPLRLLSLFSRLQRRRLHPVLAFNQVARISCGLRCAGRLFLRPWARFRRQTRCLPLQSRARLLLWEKILPLRPQASLLLRGKPLPLQSQACVLLQEELVPLRSRASFLRRMRCRPLQSRARLLLWEMILPLRPQACVLPQVELAPLRSRASLLRRMRRRPLRSWVRLRRRLWRLLLRSWAAFLRRVRGRPLRTWACLLRQLRCLLLGPLTSLQHQEELPLQLIVCFLLRVKFVPLRTPVRLQRRMRRQLLRPVVLRQLRRLLLGPLPSLQHQEKLPL